MTLKTVRFVDLFLVAMTFGLTFCHVMELPGKLRLSAPAWLAVQHQLYVAFGLALGAWIELASIALTWLTAFLVRDRRPAFGLTLAAALCVSAGLAVWFLLVAPVNVRIARWMPDTLPDDWTAFRDRWEVGQAVHCLLLALGLGSLLAAILAETPAAARPSS